MAQYVFDSNVFITLNRRQPSDIYPSLWNKLGELMASGDVISSIEVYDEISIGGDDLKEWAKKHKEYFLPSEVSVQQVVRDILKKHRGLVEGGKKKNSADPFVIALAKENQCKVVTEETRTRNMNSPKIPDVCDCYKIDCVDFVTFAREVNINF